MQFKLRNFTQTLSILLCLQFLLAISFVVESRAEIRKIVITPTQQSGRIYTCFQYQMTFLDENDQVIATQTDLTFNISTPSEDLQLFSNAIPYGYEISCTGAITNGTFIVPAGHHFRQILTRTPLPVHTKIYLEGVNTPIPFSHSLVANYSYTEPTVLKFLQTDFKPRPGLCTRLDFRYVDDEGTAIALIAPRLASFSVHPEALDILFSDSACLQPLNSYETPAGSTGGSVFTRVPADFNGKIRIYDGILHGGLVLEALPLNYDDVGVAVNQNSGDSREIADYFVHERNIPIENIFYIDAPTTEIISDKEFQMIRRQLEEVLPAHNDPDHVINYLVTTKGVPLAIERDAHINSSSTSASFESEIALLAGPHAHKIGLSAWSPNYVWNTDEIFSRAQRGSFLVTRLDAYTIEGVLELIDRSRPLTPVDVSASTSVFDQDPLWGYIGSVQNAALANAAVIMSTHGYPAELNTDTTYVTNRSNVLVYASWGSNDHTFPWSIGPSLPMFTWVPGSIAETFVSTSARSFTPGTPYGQSLIADLIEEGVCGVKGYVFEPLAVAMANMKTVTDRYTRGYNLAESFSMGTYTSSWMDVVVGDPKMSIVPND